MDPHAAEGGGLHSDLVSASTVKAQQRTGRTVGPFVLALWLVFDGSVIESSTHRTREDSLLGRRINEDVWELKKHCDVAALAHS